MSIKKLRKCKPENLLKNKYPELLKQWDYDKNVHVNADEISYASHIKVWWLCDKIKNVDT